VIIPRKKEEVKEKTLLHTLDESSPAHLRPMLTLRFGSVTSAILRFYISAGMGEGTIPWLTSSTTDAAEDVQVEEVHPAEDDEHHADLP
jgi:hypothetical protein